jgi:hypothetical protein
MAHLIQPPNQGVSAHVHPLGFQTVYDNFVGNVHSISDIHGDIQALITSLRDCSRVIRKKTRFRLPFNQLIIDPNLETNLNIDISCGDNGYDDTLGYEWCGDNSLVVICGDIIDPNRESRIGCLRNNNTNFYKDSEIPCHQYPQIEIKILRFINNINADARVKASANLANAGKIIKLLGNHDLINILFNYNPNQNPQIVHSVLSDPLNNFYKFSFRDDITLQNYYRGKHRLNIFNVGNEGFDLLQKDGFGVLVKINNSIFVHGQLTMSPMCVLSNIINANILINNRNLDFINLTTGETSKLKGANYELNQHFRFNLLPHPFIELCLGPLGILDVREWAKKENYSYRIQLGTQQNFCDDAVKNILRNFMERVNVDDLRIILGHCVQVPMDNLTNYSTFTQLGIDNDSTKIYVQSPQPLPVSNHMIPDYTNDDRTPGITMQCPKIHNNLIDYYIYHIDTSRSRAFDGYFSPTSLNKEREDIFSRTPQVLIINSVLDASHNILDTLSIVKSKIKNTRIHLPRPKYEESIKNITTKVQNLEPVLRATYIATLPPAEQAVTNLDWTLNPDNYRNKYLKYKNKYLELKNKLK